MSGSGFGSSLEAFGAATGDMGMSLMGSFIRSSEEKVSHARANVQTPSWLNEESVSEKFHEAKDHAASFAEKHRADLKIVEQRMEQERLAAQQLFEKEILEKKQREETEQRLRTAAINKSKDIHAEGEKLFAEGNATQALQHFKDALATHGHIAHEEVRQHCDEVKLSMARCYAAQGNHAEALSALKNIHPGTHIHELEAETKKITEELVKKISQLCTQAEEEFAAHNVKQAAITMATAKNLTTASKLQHQITAKVDALHHKTKTQAVSIEIKEAYSEAVTFMEQKNYTAAVNKLEFCIGQHKLYIKTPYADDFKTYVDLQSQAHINLLLPQFYAKLNAFEIDDAITKLQTMVGFSHKIKDANKVQQYGYIPTQQLDTAWSRLAEWHTEFKQRKDRHPKALAQTVAKTISKHKRIDKQDLQHMQTAMTDALRDQWHKLDNKDHTDLLKDLENFCNESMHSKSMFCGAFYVTYHLSLTKRTDFKNDLTGFLKERLDHEPLAIVALPIAQIPGIADTAQASQTFELNV